MIHFDFSGVKFKAPIGGGILQPFFILGFLFAILAGLFQANQILMFSFLAISSLCFLYCIGCSIYLILNKDSNKLRSEECEIKLQERTKSIE